MTNSANDPANGIKIAASVKAALASRTLDFSTSATAFNSALSTTLATLPAAYQSRTVDADRRILVREHFELRPYGLIEMLDLKRPIYQATAAYGHFGRDEFPWEQTDKAELLRSAAGL